MSPTIKSKGKRKPENSYFIFNRFVKKIFEKDYINLNQQEQNKKISKFWNSTTNDLKNGFKVFANRERILKDLKNELMNKIKDIDIQEKNEVSINQPLKNELHIILDDHCPESVKREYIHISNFSSSAERTSNPSSSAEEEEYNRIFHEWVDCNQNLIIIADTTV